MEKKEGKEENAASADEMGESGKRGLAQYVQQVDVNISSYFR